ncbi:hemin uptake protein HemP [Sediminimonas qiaohouensis]|nr:hemin uptake protein HemP [Sediminimonas qiaohouensis]
MSCHDNRSMSSATGATVADRVHENPSGEGVHDARALTAGAQTARIMLDGQSYTLRITRAGKLILTK